MFARAAKEPTSISGWKSSQPRTLENALKPTPPSSANAAAAHKNPLKRTASQASGGAQALSKASLSRSSSGMVGRLHDNVYFDENDFDDDDNIDLNEVTPQPASTIHYPTLAPPAAKDQSTPRASSSQTIPWSSSPITHYKTPHGSLPPHPSNVPTGAAKDPQPITYPSLPDEPKPSKRRTLPWLNEDGEGTSLDATTKPVKQNKHQKQVSKASSQEQESSSASTPLPKDKSDTPYPWNKTASALKEEHKRLRQGHRKLVKDHAAPEKPKAATTTRHAAVPKVFLSDEQRKVSDLVIEGRKSVFFTGSAGTGKSVLLREIIRGLRQRHKHESDRVAVTASTGLAACNVGGVTLHSFAGIGLGKEAVPELVKKIKRNAKAKTRWLRTKVLIVDEISMVDGDLFDKLEAIARSLRNNGRPFGGIQLVITGDFFQLPPVPDYGKVAKFCFDGGTWTTSIEHTIGLTQVFRQKDPVFADMLNEMRLGRLTPTSINAFRSLNRELSFNDSFEATELFPTRQEVDNANNNRLQGLFSTALDFKAIDGGTIQDVGQRDKLLANCMAPQTLTLKKGAQVMLIKNIDETLVNGSLGRVVAFMDEQKFDRYHENEDAFQAGENGELCDEEMSESQAKARHAIRSKELIASTMQLWPLVRFHFPDGTFRELLCMPEMWKIELPNGEIQASRTQVPLILAWALSIHKAQGQTLERVKVDLGKIFEKGQAYVALSRATCQEGLQILRFDPRKVMAHDRVRDFYNSLYSIDSAARAGPSGESVKKEVVDQKPLGGLVLKRDPWEEDDEALTAMYAGR